MKVQVDTIKGIYMVDALTDYNAPPIVSGADFIEALPTLKGGEEMAACLSFGQVRMILREGYAIRRNP